MVNAERKIMKLRSKYKNEKDARFWKSGNDDQDSYSINEEHEELSQKYTPKISSILKKPTHIDESGYI